MVYYFTSDNHFGHKAIIEYCGRPFKNTKQMDTEMIKRWNSTVSNNDTVFHLGDFGGWNNFSKMKKKLNGNIILIKGNHDPSSESIVRELKIKHGGIIWTLVHNPTETDATNVICGHVHEYWKIKRIKNKTFVNVGVDVWDFYPVTINQILKAIAAPIIVTT